MGASSPSTSPSSLSCIWIWGTWQGGTGPTCSNRTMCEESPPQKEKELSGYFFWFLVKGLADIRTRERSNFYTQYKNAYGDMGGF
jgi:hypothetical protein